MGADRPQIRDFVAESALDTRGSWACIHKTMVSLAKVKAGGRTYWRIVESRRVNGKPRPVPILNLGTADALLERLLKAPEGHLRIQSFQHGDVAALKAAADRLGVEKILDRHLQKLRKPKSRSLPVGRTSAGSRGVRSTARERSGEFSLVVEPSLLDLSFLLPPSASLLASPEPLRGGSSGTVTRDVRCFRGSDRFTRRRLRRLLRSGSRGESPLRGSHRTGLVDLTSGSSSRYLTRTA